MISSRRLHLCSKSEIKERLKHFLIMPGQLFIKQGMDLEEEITLSKYIALTPLDLALICNQPEVVKLLVEHGVNLNVKNNPAILKAVRYCGEERVRYLYQQGAKLNADCDMKCDT